MCFIIDSNHPNVKIANRDIPCYKVLNKFDNGLTFSLYKHNLYHANITAETEVRKNIERFGIKNNIIGEGLHSYSTKRMARRCIRSAYVFVSYIPKGTQYYYNSVNKEYVSLCLVVTTQTI
jgi:hypothetical protein